MIAYNDRGIALVVAMIMTLLVMIIGVTAIKMNELGYLTYGSERRYTVAKEAAEYAVNDAIKNVTSSACPSAIGPITLTGGSNAATYSYFSIPISGGTTNSCFLFGKGEFGGAKVIKTAVVPRSAVSGYGAISLRNGGSLGIGGSSKIDCDSSCATPAVKYGGNLSYGSGGFGGLSTTCGISKGMAGSPAAIVDKDGNSCTTDPCPTSAALDDMVPSVFDATNWADFLSKLSTKNFNGRNVNVAGLGIADWDTSTSEAQAMPSTSTAPTVGSSCTCTNSTFTLTSGTTSCTGVSDFSACSGAIKFTGSTITVSSIPSSISTVVSSGAVNITGSGTYSGKTIYATGSNNITVNNSGAILDNTTLIAGGTLSVTSASAIQSNSALIAEGTGGMSISASSGVTNATLVTTNSNATATITLNSGTVSNSTLITKSDFALGASAGTITDSNVFAKKVQVTDGTQGGVLYSEGDVDVFKSSKTDIGTSSKPTLLLGGGDLRLDHMSGQTSIYGLIFFNGEIVTDSKTTGQFTMSGAVISNSTTGTNAYAAKGNTSIAFNGSVLNTISTNLGGLVKAPSCGGAVSKSSSITSSKVTVY